MTTVRCMRPSNRSPSGTWDDRGARGRHRRDTCAQATAPRRYKCAPPAPRHDEHAPVRAVDAPLHPNAGKPEARRGLPRGVRAVRPHGRGARTSRQGSGIRQTVCRQRGTGQSPVIRLYTDNQARPEARSGGDACVALEVGRAGQPCRATRASPLRINPLSGMTGPGSGFGERRLTTAGDSVETKIGRRPARTGRTRFRPVAQPAMAQSWGDAPGWMRRRALRGGCAARHPARDSRARRHARKPHASQRRGRLVQRSPRIRWVARRRGIGKSGEAHRVGCDRVGCAPGKNTP